MRLRKDLVCMKLHLSRYLDLCPYCGADPGHVADPNLEHYGHTRNRRCEQTGPGEDDAAICRCAACQRFWVEGYVRRANGGWPPETIRVDAYDPNMGRILK